MTARSRCPGCGGDGRGADSVTIDYADGRVETKTRICGVCYGRGDLSKHRVADVERGRAHRAARRESGEALDDAARRLGISAAYLSRLERGLEPWPDDVWLKARGLQHFGDEG